MPVGLPVNPDPCTANLDVQTVKTDDRVQSVIDRIGIIAGFAGGVFGFDLPA